jgi:hypothetical protein
MKAAQKSRVTCFDHIQVISDTHEVLYAVCWAWSHLHIEAITIHVVDVHLLTTCKSPLYQVIVSFYTK